MTLNISGYTDPGVYIQERIQPSSVSVSSDRVLCLVGTAPRTRRTTDEAIIRGKVSAETLTVASGTPHIATLTNTSDRNRNNAIVYRNGNALALGEWSFNAASLTGTEWGGATVDVSTATGTSLFSFSADGKEAVVIDFQAGQVAGVITAANAATGAEVAAWINYELSNASGTYYSDYGASYSSFASSATGIANPIITLTSPLTTSASDIKVILSYDSSLDGASTISNAAWAPVVDTGVQASSILTIAATSYSSSDTFTIDYGTVDTSTDALENADATNPLSDIVRVGSTPGAYNYLEDTDFEETGNTIDWYISGTSVQSSVSSDTPGLWSAIVAGTNDEVKLSINGNDPVTITLSPDATPTAAEVALEINTFLATNATAIAAGYGPYYGHVATYNTGSISAFADRGDAAHVIVTSVGHTLSDGDAVTITGTTNYNGNFTASAVTATTFDIVDTWVADDGTGTWEDVMTFTAPKDFANKPVETGADTEIVLYSTTDTYITDMFSSLTFPTGVVSYSYLGTGSRPSYGSAYYCTYDYTRPTADYENPTRVYNLDQLYEYTSPLTVYNYSLNELAIGAEIAFENGVSSLIVCQVNDSSVAGTPTQTQINSAVDGCENSSSITDVVVLSSVSGDITSTQTKLMNHVANMSSLTEKKYRRGWFGMPRDTVVGDPDTPDTFVYASTQTLQPGVNSPARGRLILCAPSNCSRTITLEDGSEITVTLDGNYLATADAAKFCSLASPADALLNKYVTGFLTDSTFTTYLTSERHVLADNGVNVNTLKAGNIVLTDPLTTESGGVVQFEEPSSSAQKDAVTRSIETVLEQNVVGIVPDDLSDFITDIKSWIALAIKAQINAGSIGPYRNSDGSVRELDFTTDIQVAQDSTDPRTFTFKYWFNLKYVAKRFYGEYSVDNPFFTV